MQVKLFFSEQIWASAATVQRQKRYQPSLKVVESAK